MSLANILVYLVPFNVAVIVVNFAMLFAYLERKRLLDRNTATHAAIALVCSLPGVFTIPMLFMSVEFPKYGMRFTWRERNDFWLKKRRAAMNEKLLHQQYYERHTRRNYHDIWED